MSAASFALFSSDPRTWGFRWDRGWCWVGAGLVLGWCWVGAGLLLLTLARVLCKLNFLSLLATVRGGTSFLGPSATKKRSKENASPQSVLSVPSVQTTAFGSRVARCSQNHGHLNPSFSRILTSPRFATSALGQVQYAHGPVRPHRICGWLRSYSVRHDFIGFLRRTVLARTTDT